MDRGAVASTGGEPRGDARPPPGSGDRVRRGRRPRRRRPAATPRDGAVGCGRSRLGAQHAASGGPAVPACPRRRPAGRADGASSSSASGPRSGARRASAAAESTTWRRRSKRCSRPATARRPPPGWWCWLVSAGMPASESESSASGRSLWSRASGRRKHGVRCSSTWRLARRSRGAAKRRSCSATKRSASPAIWAIAISRSRR